MVKFLISYSDPSRTGRCVMRPIRPKKNMIRSICPKQPMIRVTKRKKIATTCSTGVRRRKNTRIKLEQKIDRNATHKNIATEKNFATDAGSNW